jgi:phosphoribosylglycinamide formyltransferase-1
VIRLGFMASNNGTSFRAIVGAIEAGELKAEARLLVANRREAGALGFAAEHGVPALCIPTLKNPDAADAALEAAMAEAGVEVIVLSGYLRKLGPRTLARWRGRVLNVHPALLPAFGGQGMYGRRVHEAVLAAGVPATGCTVHVVDEEYDHGPVVAQARVPLLPGDTAESIERRVMAAEPALFIDTLRRIAEGEIALKP